MQRVSPLSTLRGRLRLITKSVFRANKKSRLVRHACDAVHKIRTTETLDLFNLSFHDGIVVAAKALERLTKTVPDKSSVT